MSNFVRERGVSARMTIGDQNAWHSSRGFSWPQPWPGPWPGCCDQAWDSGDCRYRDRDHRHAETSQQIHLANILCHIVKQYCENWAGGERVTTWWPVGRGHQEMESQCKSRPRVRIMVFGQDLIFSFQVCCQYLIWHHIRAFLYKAPALAVNTGRDGALETINTLSHKYSSDGCSEINSLQRFTEY